MTLGFDSPSSSISMSEADNWRQKVVDTFAVLKEAPYGAVTIDRKHAGLPVILRPVTADSIQTDEIIELLYRWRRENIHSFLKIFEPTFEGTRLWADRLLIQREDRMLFLVENGSGRQAGHVGLSTFDYNAGTCEIDNIVRGDRDAAPGIIQAAIHALLDWTYENLAPREIQLRTLNDNVKALALYHRLGFVPFRMEPLCRTEIDGVLEWVPTDCSDARIDRFYLAMKHVRA